MNRTLYLIIFLGSMFKHLYVWIALIATMVFVSDVSAQYTCTVTLEAEDGDGETTVARIDASDRSAVLLEEGDSITYPMEIMDYDNFCSIKLTDVTYSIDGYGSAEYIQIRLGTTLLGSFRISKNSSSNGIWSDFITMGGFSTEKRLSSSTYVFQISAIEADGFGVQIDKLSLLLECSNYIRPGECRPSLIYFGNKPLSNEEEDNSEDNNNDKKTAGEVAGGVIGGILTIIGICCLIGWCIYYLD